MTSEASPPNYLLGVSGVVGILSESAQIALVDGKEKTVFTSGYFLVKNDVIG